MLVDGLPQNPPLHEEGGGANVKRVFIGRDIDPDNLAHEEEAEPISNYRELLLRARALASPIAAFASLAPRTSAEGCCPAHQIIRAALPPIFQFPDPHPARAQDH